MPHTSANTLMEPQLQVPEEFRTLRINLDFTTAGRGIQTIAVTSGKRQEGRTTTAAYLAAAYAQAGKRTLLLDADLREPGIHNRFGGGVERGLSHYLSGMCGSKEIEGPGPVPLLTIIRSGPVPGNPSELLASPRMEELLKELKSDYDVVIVDGPPAGYIDAKVLASQCDGVLLVVEYAKISRDTARKIAEELQQGRANVIGTVLNKSKGKDSKAYPL